MPNKDARNDQGPGQSLAVVPSREVDAALDTTELGMIPLDMAERLLVMGDLSQLEPRERLLYYQNLCLSLGLNAIARPFEYLLFKGKLSLYATKECAAQLRTKREVSFTKLETKVEAGLLVVSVEATLPNGRRDMDEGVAFIDGLRGEDLANARLKAITKAKRRVTLSLCGLGMLDETEVDSMAGAQRISVETAHTLPAGQVLEGEVISPPEPLRASPPAQRGQSTGAAQNGPQQPQRAEPGPVVEAISVDIEAEELNARFRGLYERLEKYGVPTSELAQRYQLLVPNRKKFQSLEKETQRMIIKAFEELEASLQS